MTSKVPCRSENKSKDEERKEEKGHGLSNIPNILTALRHPSMSPPFRTSRDPFVPSFLRVQRLEAQAELEILKLRGAFGSLSISVHRLDLGADDVTREIGVENAYTPWDVIGCGVEETEVGFLLARSGFEIEFCHAMMYTAKS